MSFQFRLQSVLNLRIAERDERRQRLADALHADTILEEKLKDVGSQIEDNRAEGRHLAQSKQVDVDRLLRSSRHDLQLKSQVGQLQQQRNQVAEEIERRRQVLVEADRQVKVLEKLKERQMEEYETAEALREMKQIDEVAQRVGPNATHYQGRGG